MRTIYSVLVKDTSTSFSSLNLQHTMLFENPPTNTDIASALIEFINPSKRYIAASVEARVKTWAKHIEDRKISYYALDVISFPAVWDWTFEHPKDAFSLSISGVNVHPGTPEKKEESKSINTAAVRDAKGTK